MKKGLKIKKNIQIKLPKDVLGFLHSDKNLLILVGPEKTCTIKLQLKLLLLKNHDNTKTIVVTNLPTQKVSKNVLKKIFVLRGNLISVIKNKIIETKTTFYKRLKFVGVGYRMLTEHSVNRHCTLKLGYSHLIYYNAPLGVSLFCRKLIYPTLFGKVSYYTLTQTVAKLRKLRAPEPYKGKGILYMNENIKLKTGKRV